MPVVTTNKVTPTHKNKIASAIGYAYFTKPADLIIPYYKAKTGTLNAKVIKDTVLVLINMYSLPGSFNKVGGYIVSYRDGKYDLTDFRGSDVLYSAVAQGAIPRIKLRVPAVTAAPVSVNNIIIKRDKVFFRTPNGKIAVTGSKLPEIVTRFLKVLSMTEYVANTYAITLGHIDTSKWAWAPMTPKEILKKLRRTKPEKLLSNPNLLASTVAVVTAEEVGATFIGNKLYLKTDPPIPFSLLDKFFTKRAMRHIMRLNEEKIAISLHREAGMKFNKDIDSIIPGTGSLIKFYGEYFPYMQFRKVSTYVRFHEEPRNVSNYTKEELVEYLERQVACELPKILCNTPDCEKVKAICEINDGTGVLVLESKNKLNRIFLKILGRKFGCDIVGEKVVCDLLVGAAIALKTETTPPKVLVKELMKKLGEKEVLDTLLTLIITEPLSDATLAIIKKLITADSPSKVTLTEEELEAVLPDLKKLKRLPPIIPFIDQRLALLVQVLEYYSEIHKLLK